MIKNTTDIIVTTFNRLKYFKTFIKFLYKSTKESFNLIVVDNGSVDGTREYIIELEKENKVHKHVFTSSNLPLAQAFSEGFKMSDGEFVVTVADDMVINPLLKHDWLKIFKAKMNNDNKIGCINFIGSRCDYDRFIQRYDK